MKNLLVFSIAAVVFAITLPTASLGAVLLDTGVPDESSNRSVFAEPSLPGAQFLAQQFSFADPVFVSTIEAYIGGSSGRTIRMDLATQIGTAATAADLIDTFSLAAPGLPGLQGAFASATVNRLLSPGDYYLVFSGDNVNEGWMPINAPSTIGSRYLAADNTFPFVNVNTALPIASNFRSVTEQYGIRISGNAVGGEVPEPATVSLWSLLGLTFLVGRRWRRAGGRQS